MQSLNLILTAFSGLAQQGAQDFAPRIQSYVSYPRQDFIAATHVHNILSRADLNYRMSASAYVHLGFEKPVDFVETHFRAASPEDVFKFKIERNRTSLVISSTASKSRLSWPIKTYSKLENSVIPHREIFKQASSYLKVKTPPTKLEYIPYMIAGKNGGAELAYEFFVSYGEKSVRFYYINRKIHNITKWENPA